MGCRYSLSILDLSDVVEDIDNIAYLAWSLLDLRGKGNAGHGGGFHGIAHHGLGVIEPLEQHLAGCHGHLSTHTNMISVVLI